jgi:hypothetical protein
VIPTPDVYRDSRGRMAKCPFMALSGHTGIICCLSAFEAKRTCIVGLS